LLEAHKDLIRLVGGAAVIIFGLHLSRVFKIKFLHMEKRFNTWTIAEGYTGSFLVGLAFAAGWTPCIGPILSSILVLASTQGTVYKGMLLLFLYSMGMGIPFLLTAVFVNRALEFFTVIKKYFGYIETVSGIVLIIVGVLVMIDGFKFILRHF
jgi:cytochrome c-type biogenesis protein